jgi:HlyD family secretion protein
MKFKLRATDSTESAAITAVKAVLLLIVLSFLLTPLGRGRDAQDKMASLRHTALPARIGAGGSFAVTIRLGGQVQALHVKAGDWVKEGQVLAELANPDLDAELARATLRVQLAGQAAASASGQQGSSRSVALEEEYRAAMAQCESVKRRMQSFHLAVVEETYERARKALEQTEKLAQQKLATAVELDNARRQEAGERRNLESARETARGLQEELKSAELRLSRVQTQRAEPAGVESQMARLNLEEAQANLRTLETRHADLVIKAPGAGRVVQLAAAQGDQVTAGMTLLQVVDLTRLNFDVPVTSKVAQSIHAGDAVEVIMPKDPPLRMNAQVSQILLSPEQQQPYVVRVTIPNPSPDEILVGLEGAVRFPHQQSGWASQFWPARDK